MIGGLHCNQKILIILNVSVDHYCYCNNPISQDGIICDQMCMQYLSIEIHYGVIPEVPWLPWITLRPFRCLCYHQRQLLLFLIHSHGGKSSIFYVYLWNFYLLGPEIYSYGLFKWKHSGLHATLESHYRQTVK